jgi:hypothetical protein
MTNCRKCMCPKYRADMTLGGDNMPLESPQKVSNDTTDKESRS